MANYRHARQNEAYDRMQAGEGFLYAVELTNFGKIKIGFSLNPKNRVRFLRGYYSSDAVLLAYTPGSLFQERELHRTLRPHAVIHHQGPCETYPRSILFHPALPAGLRPDIFGRAA